MGRFGYAGGVMILASAATGTAIALALSGAPDREGFPTAEAWSGGPALTFNADWQGKNADPARETEVRLLWTRDTLFLRFRCHYRNLTAFSDSEPNGRRYQLWDRDVAEVFLQPDPSVPNHYWEFEVSPNGMWIDLDIELGEQAAGDKVASEKAPGHKLPGHKGDPQTGMKSRVHLDETQKIWTAEVALPIRNLTGSFDPAADWRVNFFRVEGPTEPRFYSSWQPTKTERPSFHVPEAFGKLSFR